MELASVFRLVVALAASSVSLRKEKGARGPPSRCVSVSSWLLVVPSGLRELVEHRPGRVRVPGQVHVRPLRLAEDDREGIRTHVLLAADRSTVGVVHRRHPHEYGLIGQRTVDWR